MIEYKLTGGAVYGNLWGGGAGAYPCEKKDGFDTKEDLLKWAEAELKSGGLDSGMGYERLLGAVLVISKVQEVEVEGKVFSNVEIEYTEIGELSEKQKIFLYENI